MRRGSRILAIILGLVVSLGLMRPVHAAQVAGPALTNEEAVALLQSYGIVRGDETGNLNLFRNLTRAEAAAIFVRAMNMSAYAGQLAGAVPFTDMKGHWAAGEVAMAYQLGLMKGDPDGRFRPNDPITYAEVLTVLLRMIGQEPAGQWDPGVILWRASQVGILPAGIISSAPAVRQQIFWSLAQTMTIPRANGRTLLQNFDLIPPGLVVNDVQSPTTAERVTLTGTALDAYQVLVNGRPATFDRTTGAFSAQVDLEMGLNTFEILAFDRAGNKSAGKLSIERRPKISQIVIEGPEVIAPNSSVRLEIKALDASGNEVALENATATLSTSQHSFNLATRTLKTGNRTGRATLTVTIGDVKGTYTFEVQGPAEDAERLQFELINGGRALAPGKKYTVTVQVINEEGEVATNDYGRTVTLTGEGLDKVTISPAAAQTVKGVATFTIAAEEEGTLDLRATSNGLETAKVTLQVLDSPRVVLTSSKSRLEPDGVSETTIRARLEDDEGRAVRAREDIAVDLFLDGVDGELDGYTLWIPAGESTSEDYVIFYAGYYPGIARIEGEVWTSPRYPVQALEIPVRYDDEEDEDEYWVPRLGLSASRRDALPGETVEVTIRVVDSNGRIWRSGSYAFQIQVRTSPSVNITQAVNSGLLDLYFDGGERPIYGIKSGDVEDIVVGRTYDGEAKFYLVYHGEGTVYLTSVGMGSQTDAIHPVQGPGKASSARELRGSTLLIRFSNR